jgi:exonuclease VII small subunit
MALECTQIEESGSLTYDRSGELNAKHRELLELQQLAQRRLMGAQASFAEGMKAAKEVQKDLQWTQKRVECVYSGDFWRKPELTYFTVLSMTAQLASTRSNSGLLSDATLRQSTTRSLAVHQIRLTALLMIHTYTFRLSHTSGGTTPFLDSPGSITAICALSV